MNTVPGSLQILSAASIANTSFFDRAVSEADLPAELTRWTSWHRARTAASLGALGAALLSLARVG